MRYHLVCALMLPPDEPKISCCLCKAAIKELFKRSHKRHMKWNIMSHKFKSFHPLFKVTCQQSKFNQFR